ncbi:MAG: methyl-accepting chemotaxis protein [Melioribacter sp.]|uniref:methyl-accepting chemotaxis protein n=1 Tax=Melioribacter sp. TaxID=2052167 RepID=UPI003BC1A750
MLAKIKKSIKYQGVVISMLPLLIVILFFSIYYPMKQRKLAENSTETQARTLSEMLAFSVGAGLNDGNYELVQTAFDWAKDDKNVSFISILDENGDPIIEYNPYKFNVEEIYNDKEMSATKDLLKNTADIKYKNKNLGKIVLLYDLKNLTSEINSTRTLTIIVAVVILLLGALYIFLSFGKFTRSIIRLRDAAKSASEGNLNVTVEDKREDEVGDLIAAFKKMMEDIKESTQALEIEKKQVEKKVEEAVREAEEKRIYLTEKINLILEKMNQFSRGDLSVRLEIEKDDEIGQLFSGFNQVVEDTGKIIASVFEIVETLTSTANEISASTEEMAAGAQEQTMQTNEVATAMEEMTSTIRQTTQNTTIAADYSKKAGEAAERGGNVVRETVEGMNKIAEVVSQAAQIIKELGNSSNEIGNIIMVIEEIADQTNLLALNAAIEAARAGEQGRGFAVVADEVRKLAERTTKATKEIAAMIKNIQKDTDNAISSINHGTKEVESGKEKAGKAIVALEEIINSTNQTVDIVNQVAAASEEQSATSEEISRSIENISNVTRESAMGVQKIAHSAEELNSMAYRLKDIISHFKLDSRLQLKTVKNAKILTTNN